MAHGSWKGVQYYELIARITGQDAFNAPLTCPLHFIAASPCLGTRLGQQGSQRHVGWQAAEVAQW